MIGLLIVLQLVDVSWFSSFLLSLHLVGQRYHCDLQKNKTILILMSFKRYFSHPEKSILNLSLP